MRPALAAKSGSRGKIQVRCCHGRMASSCSPRQTVLWLTVATIPLRWTSRTMAAVLRRESGTPSVVGNSHASALTWTTISGGKSPGTARAGTLVEAGQALIKEAFPPQADDIAPKGESVRDLVIRAPPRGKQDEAGGQDLKG